MDKQKDKGTDVGSIIGLPPDISIPDHAKDICRRLRARYKLEFEQLSVKGRPFYFLKVADIEPLIAGKDIFKDTADFPFWVKIWEAAVVMAHFMARSKPVADQKVLEIGAGLGVAGIVASAFGHDVTITDYKDEILDFVRVSSAVNGCTPICTTLDWNNPSELGLFDTIIGSEVLFHEKFFDPLLDVFARYLAPGGTIYLAHDARRKSVRPFLERCKERYEIAAQKQTLRSDDETIEVVLVRLRQKA